MDTRCVQKDVQLGDPGEDENRALAAARAQSSTPKTPPKQSQNWVVGDSPLRAQKCSQKQRTWRLQDAKRSKDAAMEEPGQHEISSHRLGIEKIDLKANMMMPGQSTTCQKGYNVFRIKKQVWVEKRYFLEFLI